MRRRLSVVVFAFILVFSLASAAGAVTTIQYLHYLSGDSAQVHEELVAEFNALHPDIKVEVLYTGNQFATRDKLMAAVAAGQPPHVCLVDQFWPPVLVSTGALLPMKEFVDPEVYFADFTKIPMDTVTVDGEVWTMPFSMSNQILFYNKDKFREVGLDPDKPPTTWDELVEYSKLLTRDIDGDGRIDEWGINFTTRANVGAVYAFITFIWQAGGRLYNDDYTAAAFNEPEAIEAVNFLRDLAHKYGVLNLSPPQEGFEVGRIAMQISSTSSIEATKAKVDFDLGIAALPAYKEKVTGVGGSSLAIFKTKPEEQAAAWKFVEWMSSPETNLKWSTLTGYTPLRKSVLESAEYKQYLAENPDMQVVIDQAEYAKARPNEVSYADVSRILGVAIEEALFSNLDPKPILDAAVEEANIFIEQSKW